MLRKLPAEFAQRRGLQVDLRWFFFARAGMALLAFLPALLISRHPGRGCETLLTRNEPKEFS